MCVCVCVFVKVLIESVVTVFFFVWCGQYGNGVFSPEPMVTDLSIYNPFLDKSIYTGTTRCQYNDGVLMIY